MKDAGLTKHAYTDSAVTVLDEIATRLAPEAPRSARATTLSLYTMTIGTGLHQS